ncbi:MAG: site-specific integrase [Candidatus Bathyarchaeia archaeon]
MENLPEKPLGTILSYAWQLKKDGKAEETLETVITRLKRLSKLCNLNDPEQVKATLATQTWKNITKHNVAQIYKGYLTFIGKTWIEPKYEIQNELPFIPTEAELDSLISAATTCKTATLLQLLKETGARIGEIEKLKWTHLDPERRTIYITAEKGSNSRILPITVKLLAMFNNLKKINDKVFQTNKRGLRKTFESHRNRAAKKLNNPRLKNIHFHTFRHWKGTIEYHKTKDIIHVKTVLGHKSIESTMVYINLEQALFLTQSDEWTCKTATNVKEATNLIETGFEYIQEKDGISLYRKRK